MTDLTSFTFQAREVHGNKYEYVEAYYNESHKRWHLKIKCQLHGLFDKRASNHISKRQGCPSCTQKHKLSMEDFLAKAQIVHDKRYIYDKVRYQNRHEKITITCQIHGDFEMLAGNHLDGQGCPSCSKCAPLTTEILIERLKELRADQYDFSKVTYRTGNHPVIVVCPHHGEFESIPTNLLDPRTKICCNRCNPKRRVTCTKDFIEDASAIHKNLYDYSKVTYRASIEKVIITCATHGDFFQRPNDHLAGDGCPLCGKGRCSQICIEWLDMIASSEKICIQHAMNGGEKSVSISGKKFFFDGYDNSTNTVYEFYGDFHHGNPELYDREDINPLNKISFGELYDKTIEREKTLKTAGYHVVSIWEKTFKDQYGKKKNIRNKKSTNQD